jgi:hypothetical protein
MSDDSSHIELPDNWDELDDAQKDEATRDLLSKAAEDTGVTESDDAPADDGGERPARTFQEPGQE